MFLIELFLSLFFIFFLITFLIGIKSLIDGYNFGEYLKKNYYSKWSEITSFDNFSGPGMNNPLKVIPYIYSNENNEDERILRYKDKAKINLRWTLIAFFICIVLFILLMFFIYFYGISN